MRGVAVGLAMFVLLALGLVALVSLGCAAIEDSQVQKQAKLASAEWARVEQAQVDAQARIDQTKAENDAEIERMKQDHSAEIEKLWNRQTLFEHNLILLAEAHNGGDAEAYKAVLEELQSYTKKPFRISLTEFTVGTLLALLVVVVAIVVYRLRNRKPPWSH